FAAGKESQTRREAQRASRPRASATRRSDADLEDFLHSPDTQHQVQTDLRSRSVAWVIGTSAGFELVILGLGAWVFCRRDY
ncbi:MAG: hypothetical protein ACREJC_10415, partial [Tepidisphaeraceae bacterium]